MSDGKSWARIFSCETALSEMHAAFLFHAFLYSRFNYYNCPQWSKLKTDSEATISENTHSQDRISFGFVSFIST